MTDLISRLQEGPGPDEDHAEWYRKHSDEVLVAIGKWKREAEGLRGPNGVLYNVGKYGHRAPSPTESVDDALADWDTYFCLEVYKSADGWYAKAELHKDGIFIGLVGPFETAQDARKALSRSASIAILKAQEAGNAE